MAPTIGQVETKVREYLLDTEEGAYRYAPWLIISAIYDGIRVLHQVRPDTRYDGLKLVRREYPYVTSTTDDNTIREIRANHFPVDVRWEQAIRYYAASKCFEVDSADTVNITRANECKALFTTLLA